MKVLVVGGGAGGLLTAIVLGRDGHEVTILERDEQGPPVDDDAAWDDWERPGVNQFRQPHGFIGRTRQFLAEEIPGLWAAIESTPTFCVRLKDFSPEPEAPPEDVDDMLQVEVMRRPTFERLLALVAEATPNLTVRRGVAAKGLVTGPEVLSGIPHVVGVETESHGDITAGLVIDAAGRRTPFPRWLRALGTEVGEWRESDGFTYFTRWFRTHDGTYPELKAGFLAGFTPGLFALVFPGDAGVFGIAMVGMASDKMLRRLRDGDRFIEVASRMDPVAHWIDPDVSRPITDVMPMGSIQNRHTRFWIGEAPAATGVVNVADAAHSTNPSLGRGVALASHYAMELREVLRQTDDPEEIVTEFDRVQEERLTPWLNDAVESDRATRAAFDEAVTGQKAERQPADRTILQRASFLDMDIWRRWSRVRQVFDMPRVCLEDQDLMDRARRIAEDAPPAKPHLTRDELTELLD